MGVVAAPVIRHPMLLKMKRDAGRPQDLADIADLEEIEKLRKFPNHRFKLPVVNCLLLIDHKLAFNSSRNPLIFSKDCIITNFSSAFLFFFK